MTAIIVNYQSEQMVVSLVKSLLNCKSIDRFVIVDNSSKGDTLESLASDRTNKIDLITNPRNFGFAKAVNLAIRKYFDQEKDGFILINPDIVASSQQIDELIKSNGDICGPVIKFKRNNEWVYDFGGKVDYFFGKTRHIESSNTNLRLEPIEYVTGALMYIRSEVLQKIDYLDEAYFMYYEDVDLCLRAKRMNFKVIVNTNVIVEHKIQEHKIVVDHHKISYLNSSRLHFIFSHLPFICWPTALIDYGFNVIIHR